MSNSKYDCIIPRGIPRNFFNLAISADVAHAEARDNDDDADLRGRRVCLPAAGLQPVDDFDLDRVDAGGRDLQVHLHRGHRRLAAAAGVQGEAQERLHHVQVQALQPEAAQAEGTPEQEQEGGQHRCEGELHIFTIKRSFTKGYGRDLEQGIQWLNRTTVKPVQCLQFTYKPWFRSLQFT